jgi:hypothetical protein
MELSAEKNFENEKYKKYFQINDIQMKEHFKTAKKKIHLILMKLKPIYMIIIEIIFQMNMIII